MAYVDGFLIPVPEGKKEAYRKLAAMAAPACPGRGDIGGRYT